MRQQIDEDVQRPFEDMGWAERIDFVQRLSFYPALTVMVFLRRGLGFRMVKPNTLLIVALMLFAVGKYIPSTEYPPATPSVFYNPTFNDVAMMVFAVAVLLFGLVHRRRRWEDFRDGLPWHSYNEGDSWLLPFFGSAWLGKLLVKVVMRVARRSAAKTPNGPGARLMAALGLEKAPPSSAAVPPSSAAVPAIERSGSAIERSGSGIEREDGPLESAVSERGGTVFDGAGDVSFVKFLPRPALR